jgi:probable rRNA maturation factor
MNSFEIDIQQKTKVVQSIVTALRSAVNVTLRHEKVKPPTAVTVLLTDDAQLKQLNKEFRGINEVTDVLSFASEELLTGIDNDEAPYLGDIAISVPMAKRQAKAGGHSLKSELQLLTVHGTLHLLGYDHEEAEEKKLMWAAQSSILAQVGAEITSPE